ncbi:MAG: flavin reductase family protein [Candidatus Cyclobacteriaceae bacterium M2_1C_046]
MKTINPKEVTVPVMHSYLLGAVAPRPIAFASTIDKEGNVNLSPFSFFNCFGANPPILVFSPARRGRDNTTKHTYENVLEIKEVVINVVNYDIVEQMSLASTEYPKGVDEFVKSGLTAVESEMVKPPRVEEAPVAFECRVNDIVPLGQEGGAGNLVICEVLLMHVKEEILDENGKIDPYKLDAVARMGGNYYCRAKGDSIFEIPKPLSTLGVGVDQIPEEIRKSNLFTGNELARLGNVEKIPVEADVKSFASNIDISEIKSRAKDEKERKAMLFELARQYLQKGDINNAWKILLQK